MQKDNFYNLHDMSQGIQRSLSEGLSARMFPGEQAMISVVRIDPGHKGKLHAHPEEQWGVLLQGSGIRTQDGEEIEVKEGDFWCTPGNIEHTFQAGPEGATVLDVFAPPREDYRKAGSGFGGSDTV
ncbi:MAG: cupin domain-containing protein [Hyphomicrobiaceae bacterium]|nr:cupin domain-containing protein [Hyphomicrobiaceae bacterium]